MSVQVLLPKELKKFLVFRPFGILELWEVALFFISAS